MKQPIAHSKNRPAIAPARHARRTPHTEAMRLDAVSLARRLCADSGYPNGEVIREIARAIANRIWGGTN